MPETFSRLNCLYAQRIDVEPKLAAADAILTPKSPDDDAYLIQITVGKRKTPLKSGGIISVESALKAMYQRFASDSSDETTAAAWANKDHRPVVLYIVPSDKFVSSHHGGEKNHPPPLFYFYSYDLQDTFNADPTPGIKRRLVVSFPVRLMETPRCIVRGQEFPSACRSRGPRFLGTSGRGRRMTHQGIHHRSLNIASVG